MKRVKILRILMLLTLVVFIGVVITSYRTSETISDTTADEDLRLLVDGEQLIQKEFNQQNYQKEDLESEISAREMVNYQDGVIILEGVNLTHSKDGTNVQSDFGRHDPESENSFFWENVQISDGQGLTIKTESALHDQVAGIVAGDKPVEFSHSRISGSSLGVLYNVNTNELQLPARVDLTIHGEEGSDTEPVSVRAGFLKIVKNPGIAYLARGVILEQGRLSLRCQSLRIDFDEASRRIRHVSAFGDVVLAMAELSVDTGEVSDSPPASRTSTEDTEGILALGGDPGRKTLHAQQLEVFFDRDAGDTVRLEYLVARGAATEKAVLRLYPQPADGPPSSEIRQLEGHRLVFRFRTNGPPNRLDSFHAQGGCLLRIIDGGPEEVRLAGETLNARFDSMLQDLKAAEISGGVLCSRGSDRVRGERASYDAVDRMLFISGKENGQLPRLWNDTMELEAQRLIYSIDGQLVQAEEDVWVKVIGKSEEKGLDVALFSTGSDEEPIYIHADRLESDLEAGVSCFRGAVRVLKDENVLSARNLWLYHEDRRMEALERVSLIIHPLASAGDADVLEQELGSALPAASQLAKSLPGGVGSSLESIPPEDQTDEEAAADGEAFDKSAPLQITCRELTYDDLGRYIILDDRVIVRKHKTRLSADHMEVQLDQEENRILHIIASATQSATPDNVLPSLKKSDRLMTGFDRQAQRLQGTGPVMPPAGETLPGDGTSVVDGSTRPPLPGGNEPVSTGDPSAGGNAAGGRAGATRRPQIPQVTISQPGGRVATGERIMYYPGEQVAVVVGLDSVATVVDPRSGSAQGTTLTYHLADGKILNRANENEVTLILLHSGASSSGGVGSGSSVSTRGTQSSGAASTRSARAGSAGRSTSR